MRWGFHCLDSLEISKSAKSIEAFCWGINQHWRFEVFLKRQVKWINWKSSNLTYLYIVFSANALTLSKKDQKRRIGWIVHIQAEVLAFCFMVYHGVPTSLSSRPPKPSQQSCLETRMDLATSLSSKNPSRVQSDSHFTKQKSFSGWNSLDPFFFSKNLSLNCEVELFSMLFQYLNSTEFICASSITVFHQPEQP